MSSTLFETRKFSTILADPPWSKNQTGKYGAANHYNLMTMEAIKDMPVKDLAAKDAHLWLWVPNGLIPEGIDVMRAWGFEYRNIFEWIKPNKMPLGYYIRNGTETALFGVRGSCPSKFKNQINWLMAPVQDHSHKPEEMFPIIERVSPGPYLELFARRQPSSCEDWSIWGNEVASDVVIPGYPVPRYSDKVPAEVIAEIENAELKNLEDSKEGA